MTLKESIELREIRTRLGKNHATRADIDRARDILSGNDSLLYRFEAEVAEKAMAKQASDKTAAARKARQRERENSFEIPLEPLDPKRREDCKYDLVLFGITYCSHLLKHRPSEYIIKSLIRPIQNVILYGGQQMLEQPRGIGKTTWLKIALIWAVVYGHKRFVVVLAATGGLSGKIISQVKGAFEKSVELGEDFPALCMPIRALANNWRRAATQKYEGRPTLLSFSASEFVLPTIYRTGTDEKVEVAAGAKFCAYGLDGAFKGLGEDADRPDLILIDDPQKRKTARSPKETDRIEETIVSDAIPSFGQTGIVAAVMAVTPICVNDVAWRFASRKRHPEWGLSKQAYLIEKSERFDELFPAFRLAYSEDVDIADAAASRGETVTAETKWALSDQFYKDHLADFAGTEVVDPLNFAPGEVDAIHHLLKLMAKFHNLDDFEAEYQMEVSLETDGEPVMVEEVERKVNGYPRCTLPPGTYDAVAFCDVNTARGAGLRWGVLAVGPGRVTAVVAYGTYPADGSALVPANTPKDVASQLVQAGCRAVVQTILKLPLHMAETNERVVPRALCFDAGYMPTDVHRAVASFCNVPLYGMEVMCSLGRSWSQFKKFRKEKGTEEKVAMEKNHPYAGVTVKTANGRIFTRKYLGMHSDYWREIAQTSFRQEPLAQGSCSLYGDRPSVHHDFALEVTYEQLVRVYRDDKTLREAWEWYNESPGNNHWGDVLYGCFAVAGWKDLYRPTSRLLKSAVHVKSLPKPDWLAEAEKKELEQAAARRNVKMVQAVKKAPPKLFRKISRPRFVK